MNIDVPERITVVQIGKLGDMILTTPLFRKLKSIFPGAELSVLASPGSAIIAENDQNIDKVFHYTKKPLKDLKLMLTTLMKTAVWIDTKPELSDTSKYLLKIFQPSISIGYNHENNRFDIDLTQYESGEHAVDINIAPVRYFGSIISEEDRRPAISVDAEIERVIVERLGKKNLARLTINVSAGKIGRQIETEVWINVVNLIREKMDTTVQTICHPQDKEISEEIFRRTGAEHCVTKDILEAAAVVKSSDYVISPDTSIVHLCSAFNKPVTAIYPNVDWNLKRFAPLSKYQQILVSDSSESIKTIKPQNIVNAFMRLYEDVTRGNAESRTRVRKEDH